MSLGSEDQRLIPNSFSCALLSASKQSFSQHPAVLLEAARKTERKEIGKRRDSNCYQENVSETEGDQIQDRHYHFY